MTEFEKNQTYLTDTEIYKFIPKSFVIACHTINIIVKDIIIKSKKDDDDVETIYGLWNDGKLTIELARTVKIEGEVIALNKEQILNSFYHELFHCFCFFACLTDDEFIVQSMANFMREFETTRKY